VELENRHRRYLFEQGLGAVVVNIVINAAIAWLLFRSLQVVSLWGPQSIAIDTLATCVILPFLTCLIVTRMVKREVSRGRLPLAPWRRASHAALGRLPRNTLLRASAIAAGSVSVAAPLGIGVFVVLGITELGLWQFVAFKAFFAGALGGVVSPLVALCALGDLTESDQTGEGKVSCDSRVG
jgi:hypothetical protein